MRRVPAPMRRTRGFTLIELVAVIVILGILAAVALPQMSDLRRDARIAAVEHLRGTVETSVRQVRMAAMAQGVDGTPGGPVQYAGASLAVYGGWPPADGTIAHLVDLSGFTASYFVAPSTWNATRIALDNAPDPTNCAVLYEQRNDDPGPEITTVTSGC